MSLDREYKIDSSTRRCRACERVFAAGDEYYSAVVETAEENLLARHDLCTACWKPDAAYFSFWKTRVPQPEPPLQRGPRLIDLGRLIQLFEHLAGSEDPQAVRFRYVLALVLMRKRRLRVLETRRLPGGRGEELLLREVGTQRQHTLAAPSVSEEEIRSVADRLRDILDMPEKWDQAPSAAEGEAAGAEGPPPAPSPAPESKPQPEGAGDASPEASPI
ncbi:MAG: hypothetical protein FJ288_08460 [Planctomycetes bacterium]|nr:hypothetical protein [Planctomycetota bacterium]